MSKLARRCSRLGVLVVVLGCASEQDTLGVVQDANGNVDDDPNDNVNDNANDNINDGGNSDGRCIIGTGGPIVEQRSTLPFDAVAIDISLDAVLALGSPRLEIEGQPEIVSDTLSEVRDGELRLRAQASCWQTTSELVARIDAPALRRVDLSSPSSLSGTDTWTGTDLDLRASEGQLTLAVEATRLTLDASTVSRVELRGRVDDLDVVLREGSELHAADLVAENVTIRASSVSVAYVHAEATLSAELTEMSVVHYRGDPSIDPRLDELSALIPLAD